MCGIKGLPYHILIYIQGQHYQTFLYPTNNENAEDELKSALWTLADDIQNFPLFASLKQEILNVSNGCRTNIQSICLQVILNMIDIHIISLIQTNRLILNICFLFVINMGIWELSTV